MNGVVSKVALSMLLVAATPVCARAASGTALSGVIRDAHGVPQMGALVELLGPNASIVARAFTDDHGRYLLASVLPGSYQLRASAAFLIPVMRSNLRLRTGMHTVADLTLATMFDAGNWLPTERRTAAEPSDDWRWTLRSSANRPLLRLVDDPRSGSASGVSSSVDRPGGLAASRGEIAFLAGDGSFGQGGGRQEITLDRAAADGDVSIVRANLGDASPGAGTSMTLTAGLQHTRTWGGGTRMVLSFASHPELETGASTGVQTFRTAATEKIVLGDAVVVDAGTLLTAEHMIGTRFESAPYIRVAFRPTAETSVEYRLATDRVLQSSEDLDRVVLPEEALSDAAGRPLVRKSLHQELAVVHKGDSDAITIAVYRDSNPLEVIQGGGVLQQRDVAAIPVILDPTTDTLRFAVHGFNSFGGRAACTSKLSEAVSATLDAELGTALVEEAGAGTFADLPGLLHPRVVTALSGKLETRSKRTGSSLDVTYRWQPRHTLTQVDEFDAAPGEAFLGMQFRQKLWSGHRLRRVNAIAEVRNLLSQGYEPVLGSDGQTLFLAQMPRSLQAGLAFSF